MGLFVVRIIVLLVLVHLGACIGNNDDTPRIVIWHQMRPDERAVLQRQLAQYSELHPGVSITELYKETEELRSGYVIASLAGQGPDLVYGPSDPVGVYAVTETIRPLDDLLESEFLALFDSSSFTFYNGVLYQLADKVGNHLALVYNKRYVRHPPETDEELIALGKKIQEQHGYRGGKPNVYALTWNYTEPFFFIPFLTGFGGWVFAADGVTPDLNTPMMVNALNYVRELRDVHRIIPGEADYEIADALFKDEKAAMIINGDWSWAGYRLRGLDVGIAPLPKIARTGLWCAPMTSPKGYSLNVNVSKEKLPLVVDLLKFLLSEEKQLETVRALSTIPTRKSLQRHPEIVGDHILINSLLQVRRGKPMPVVPEMRAVWDAMRPGYQAVMGGALSAEEAAQQMQALALRKIRDMNE
jgi:maltose-binding protein MalE